MGEEIMLHLAGSDVQEIFEHLPGINDVPHVVRDPPYYDVAIQRLDEHFEPMRRRNYERHLFRQIVQKADERFADFVLRLRIQAKRCEFDRYDARETEDRIIEQIVEACRSNELRRQILAKDMSLEEILTLGTTLADVQLQVKELDRDNSQTISQTNIGKVFKTPFKFIRSRERNPQQGQKATNRACFACGRRGHLKGDAECLAKNAKCFKCGEIGHMFKRCLKRVNTTNADTEAPRPKRIRAIKDGDTEMVDKENVFFVMGRNSFEFVVGGVKIPMTIDSGADANIIDEATWMLAQEVGITTKSISKDVDRKLIAYATENPMKITCMFWAEIQAGSKITEATFYVVEGGRCNLLGDKTANELKVLKVGFDVGSVD